MIYVNGIPGRTAEINGHGFLFFTGFAYLGMPSLRGFQEKINEGVRKYGAVFPSSRVSNSRLALYEDFEEALSQHTGFPASACFSSGYLAAQAAVQLASREGELFYLEGAHPSLKIFYGNQSAGQTGASEWIVEKVQASATPCTIIMESVNPLTGKVSDFDWLLGIGKKVRVIVDDSHGIGILGEKGEGVSGLLPHSEHLNYLICYSLSKAFSCEGGAVSGDAETVKLMKERPPFSAATPMSPAFVHAWMESRLLFGQQRKKLRDGCLYFSKQMAGMGDISYDSRLPLARTLQKDIYEKALKHHILLSAFRYPTEADPLMTRIVINALHTRDDLDRLVHCMAND